MAARPHLQNLSAQIERLGGEDWVFDQIAAAEPMRKIAGHFTNPETGEKYSRQMVYSWIHAGGPDREKKWEEAKEIAAHIHAEDAGLVLDDSHPITSAEAAHIKNRSEHRKWLAKTFNKRVYGEDAGKIDLQLNIGQLHLDALRAASTPREIAPRETPVLASVEGDAT